MKLTIKSLKQVVYTIEVESDQIEVLELKKQIEAAHQFDHTTLNLVFNGSKLVDTKKLCEYNIKEDNVIIMMSSKVKPVNINSQPQEESKKEEKQESKPAGQSTTTSANAQSAQAQPIPSAQQKPKKDYSSEVKMLMDMGFPNSESESAISAARGNINLAIEFLSTGIPDNLPAESDEAGEGAEAQGESSALRNIASLVKILCQNDPSKFQNLLMSLQQTSPEIVELIQEHEAEFKELIQAPITEEDIRNFQAFNQGAGMGAMPGQGPQGAGGAQRAGAENVIRLTKEEFEAVNRLKELGFNEREAVQAFFACDKNEELAANFLMENRIREQEEELNIDCKIFFSFVFEFWLIFL